MFCRLGASAGCASTGTANRPASARRATNDTPRPSAAAGNWTLSRIAEKHRLSAQLRGVRFNGERRRPAEDSLPFDFGLGKRELAPLYAVREGFVLLLVAWWCRRG
jgi:hypothetical protein